jgi:preprotein translocase subunit SecB
VATPDLPAPPDKQPGVAVANIFLDHVSFAHRVDPLTLPASTPANVGDLTVNVEMGIGGEGGVLGFTRITVSTNPANEPVYNVTLSMTGLFARQSDDAMPIDTFLKNNSVALMYPFVREAFANITGRGRFGPVWLNPFNTRGLSTDAVPAPQVAKAREFPLPNGETGSIRVLRSPDVMDGGEWEVTIKKGPIFHVIAGGRRVARIGAERMLEEAREAAIDALVSPPEKQPGERYTLHLGD